MTEPKTPRHSNRFETLLAKFGKAAAYAVIIALIASTPVSSSGAWFVAQARMGGNTVSTSTLEAPLTVNAMTTGTGVNVSWNSALSQQWATANAVTGGVQYALKRSINGQSTNVYNGGDSSFFDKFPKAINTTVGSTNSRTTISSGAGHSLAITTSGSILSWGRNDIGQLGLGNTTTVTTPTQIGAFLPSNVSPIQVSASVVSSFVLASDSTVWAFGRGAVVCSNNNWTDSSVPIQGKTPQGKQVVAIAAIQCNLMELASDGTAWLWTPGSNPAQVTLPGGRLIKQITNDYLVLATDGTVWGWGDNADGHVGTGTADFVATPTQAQLPSSTIITQISSYSSSHVLALASDGTVWGWGRNYANSVLEPVPNSGQTQVDQFLSPVVTTFGQSSAFRRVVSTIFGSFVLLSDGSARAIGGNTFGVLGSYSPNYASTGVEKVKPPSGVLFTDIVGGADNNAMGLGSDGRLWAWGSNWYGELGIGFTSTGSQNVPLQASTGASIPQESSSSITNSTCANGATPTNGVCPLTGTIQYTISYSAMGWSSPARMVSPSSSSSSPLLVSSGLVKFGLVNACLDILGSSTKPAAVDFYTCNGTSGQQWTSWSDGTLRSNGMCLDIAGNSTLPGALVGVFTCNQVGGQIWVPRGDGTLFNPQSGLCLDDPNGSTTLGTQLRTWDCNTSAAQRWSFLSNRSVGALVGADTNTDTGKAKCVDNGTNTASAGNPIIIFNCNGVTGQQWTKSPDGTLRSYNMCMGVVGNAKTAGSLLELQTCDGRSGQQWALQPGSVWKNPASGLCLDDSGSSTANTTRFELWNCNGAIAQKWTMVGVGNPIVGPGSAGKCLDVGGNLAKDGQPVDIWPCNGVAGQTWSVMPDNSLQSYGMCLTPMPAADGKLEAGSVVQLKNCVTGSTAQQWVSQANSSLVNTATGLCLDSPASSTADGTQLQLWNCTGGDAQRWVLI